MKKFLIIFFLFIYLHLTINCICFAATPKLVTKLNDAFEYSEPSNFLSSYVSYANQPGCSNAHVFSHVGKPWLTQYWVRKVRSLTYGGTTPEHGYGENDEDQGQMAGISALMSIGLFSLDGGSCFQPQYDITSPIFDEIIIQNL